ncbi:hypothetical protein ACQ4PT_008289 [Festuca glaucescens]
MARIQATVAGSPVASQVADFIPATTEAPRRCPSAPPQALLHYKDDNSIDYDRDIHASNYWVCDGIVSGDSAWEIGGQLHKGMRLNYLPTKQDHGEWFDKFSYQQEKNNRWISITSKSAEIQNIQSIPKETTSYFLTLKRYDHPTTLPEHLFEQSGKLRVLRLSWCTFSFASPPFICCSNLRFLLIDSCRDDDVELIGKGDDKQDAEWASLQRLWVLDIRRTSWDWILSPSKMVMMIELRELNLIDAGASRSDWCMSKLELTWFCALQRLRVISSSFLAALVEDSFMGMQKLELLDLSEKSATEVLPNLSTASELKVLILDGCDGLQHVEADTVSASLESFSFDGFGRASRLMNSVLIAEKEVRPSSRDNQELPKVSKISLDGCARMKNVFLRGLPNLEVLNLSGTAIQALDLEAMKEHPSPGGTEIRCLDEGEARSALRHRICRSIHIQRTAAERAGQKLVNGLPCLPSSPHARKGK